MSFSSNKFLASIYEFGDRLKIRFFFDFLYVLYTTACHIIFRSKFVSANVVTSLFCNQVHFSSCHLDTLIRSNELWKILLPNNFFYMFLEYFQYKFNPNHKIFLSEFEFRQFKKVYGYSFFKRKCIVVPPVLSKSMLGEKRTRSRSCISKRKRFVFIGYNFRLKCLDDAISVLSGLRFAGVDIDLEVVGSDPSWKPDAQCEDWVSFRGSIPYSTLDWSRYDALILLSVSESYAFVVQEAMFHSLVPIVTKSVGANEHATHLGLPILVIDSQISEPSDFARLSESLQIALITGETKSGDWHSEAWREYSKSLIKLLKL